MPFKNKEDRRRWEKEHRERNKEKYAARQKKYKDKNKDKIAAYDKKNYEENRDTKIDYSKNYYKNRRKTDSVFRATTNIKMRLSKALKYSKTQKNNSTMTYVGCTKLELKIHLENQFKEGMSWENYGKWHIDHKIPFAYFIQEEGGLTEENLYSVMHYSNLQPLWAEENLKKNGNYK